MPKKMGLGEEVKLSRKASEILSALSSIRNAMFLSGRGAVWMGAGTGIVPCSFPEGEQEALFFGCKERFPCKYHRFPHSAFLFRVLVHLQIGQIAKAHAGVKGAGAFVFGLYFQPHPGHLVPIRLLQPGKIMAAQPLTLKLRPDV